ncbi:FGGY family carbohydrate kinase [Streptomyces sp. NPDC056500]|uniref:FGGY family carbohydrate kinase n=1 Tax=Streptomyces sp. NPDC056500 TaxID=3345840 RepID=UPI00367429A3
MTAFIGIDAGTSMVKAVAFDEHGQPLHTESRPLRLDIQDGRVEQDMDEVYGAVQEVTAALTARIGQPALVGLTGQGDGVWLVDESGRGVRPAISWMDGRARDLVEEWQAAGIVDTVYRRTGSAVFPGCPGPVLAWLDRYEPAALDAAAAAVSCKDMVFQRLTGVRATDVSDASMPFLDPRTRNYSDEVVASLGLTHRRRLLPAISDPIAVAELPSGAPVTSGPYDLAACAEGAGVTSPGDGLLIVGTCLAALVVTRELDLAGEPAGLHISIDRREQWLRAMPAMVGTAALDWVLGITGVSHSEVNAVLDATTPGARGVRALPYFAPSGERAPFVEPRLRAQFTGVSLETTREDLVRAVCEGIGFAARHCLEAAGLTGSPTLCGGGTRSSAWTRLFADVLGRPLRIAEGEVGARGAVLSAARRCGTELDTARWTAPVEVVEPDPARTVFYAKAYEDHLEQLTAARALARAS